MAVIVYPMVALFAQGFLNIIGSMNKRNRGRENNFLKIIIGIGYMVFSIWFLRFLFSFPNVTSQIILNLIALPIGIVGISGIIKGLIIDIYSLKFRIINIIIGGFSLFICITTIISQMILLREYFILHLINLSIALVLNILGRAGLYLSEFGLSMFRWRNFKIFFYIISDYLLQIDNDGNLILDKIE